MVMEEIGDIEEQLSDFEKIIEYNIVIMHRECLQRIKVVKSQYILIFNHSYYPMLTTHFYIKV